MATSDAFPDLLGLQLIVFDRGVDVYSRVGLQKFLRAMRLKTSSQKCFLFTLMLIKYFARPNFYQKALLKPWRS